MKSVADQFVEELADLNERELDVVRNRIIVPKAKTLDEIAKPYGLTRESIRLYEKRLRGLIDKILFGSSASHIQSLRPKKSFSPETGYPIPVGLTPRFRIDALNQAAFEVDSLRRRSVVSFSTAAASITDFNELIPALDITVGELISFATNGFAIHEGLVYVPNVEIVRLELAKAFVRNQSVPHVVSTGLDAFLEETVIEGLSVSQKQAFLAKEGYEVIGALCFGPGAKSQEDKAVAFLSLNPGKQTTETLLKAVAPEASMRSFIQRLKEDPRISRPDSKHFELAVNGKENFVSINKMIEEILVANDAPMKIEAITKIVLEKRPEVSAGSVRAYAERFPFTYNAGIVSFATEVKRPRKTAEKTKNLYRLTNGWRVRLVLNHEYLRGSSIPLGMGVVNALALELKKAKVYKHELDGGELTVKWDGAQPHLSSVKRVANELKARVGDTLLIDFIDNGTAQLKHVREDASQDIDLRLKHLVGLADDQEILVWLPTMLGIASKDKAAIVEALSKRQEKDLATLVGMI